MFRQRKHRIGSSPPLLREQADRARDARDWPRAATLYASHLERHADAGDAALWVQLGNCRKEAGDRDGALGAYRRALDLSPERADTHLQMGHLHKLCGRLDDAAASYAAALRLDPTRADAGIELAALETIGDAASRGAPGQGSDDLGRADAARDAGHWSLAADLYAAYLAACPDAADVRAVWVQLGHARKEAGDRDGAVLAYETALGLDPDDAETHVHLGHLHKAMGATDAAVRTLREAIRLAPQRDEVARDLRDLAAIAAAPAVRRSAVSAQGALRYALPLPWSEDRGPFQSPFPPIHTGLGRRFGESDAGTP